MSRYFESSHVAKTFEITVSKRYRRFLAKERKGLGKRFAVLPSYQAAMPVSFGGAALESFFREDWPEDDPEYGHPPATEVELGGADGWVPLATIGEEEPQFLVVRASDEACQVAMWEHETGEFVACASSLDAFLAGLAKTVRGAKPPASRVKLDKVRALTDKLHALSEARPGRKRTAELEAGLTALAPMLAAMPHTSMMSEDNATVPGLAHHARGVALRALQRPEEAVVALERAQIDGVSRNVAPRLVADILLHDLDRPQQVVELCAGLAASAPHRTWVLALFRLGRVDEAATHLEPIIERQVAASLKLNPRVDRTAETARCTAHLAKAISEYATRHQLDASVLLARLPGIPSKQNP